MAKKLTPLEITKAVMRSSIATAGLEPRLLRQGFRITDASNGRVDFELDIRKEHTNRVGIIHGGALAFLTDLGGTLAVASTGRFWSGVSTDINVTYLNPGGKVGDLVKATATCDKIGKKMAYTSITFTNTKGQVAARGSHTKFVTAETPEKDLYTAPDEFLNDID